MQKIRGRFLVTYKSGREEKIFPKNGPHKIEIEKDLKTAKEIGAVTRIRYEGQSKWD